jgi:ERCC4-type nuclease
VNKQTFTVVVDDRESTGAVLAALQQREGVQVRVERLPVGDYLVDDALLFERKTLQDLAASIKDGRLFAQGLRLANAPLRSALILEGSSRDLVDSRMRREAIQGALVTLALFLGIPLLRSMDAEETASLILFAARQGRAFAAGALPRKGKRPRGKPRVQSRILQGLPGIGPERARRLLERFGSIEAVMAAPASELACVTGIGMATAESIRWAVQEAAGGYSGTDGGDPLWPV